MRSINNKYIVQNEIDGKENFSSYIVENKEKNKKYVLYILKSGFTYEKSREYLLSKFKTIRNLNFNNVVNLIDIEIIYSIDGIKLDKPQYGYLTEYIEFNIDAEVYFKQCTVFEKLDIFMDICSAVHTLNIKGYIFEDITIKDIRLATLSNNKVQVKIKNLLLYEINKFRLSDVSTSNRLPYPLNIEKKEDANVCKDNISQILSMFNDLFKDELDSELKQLKDINKRYNQASTVNKLCKLKYFIKYISERIHKTYKSFDFDALNKIETDLDIIGMEEELQKVDKEFQKILDNKQKHKIIAFNGENGCGKSRLLKQIKYNIDNKYFKNIFHIKSIEKSKMNIKEIYDKELNYIYDKVDKSLRDKYEVYINKFIQILSDEEYIPKNQELQLINRIGKFIHEYTMSESLILLIDDLEDKSEMFKLFIRYISFSGNNLENLMIVFSMNESKCNSDFKEFLKELKTLDGYEEYKINYLNQYNTTNMVKSILNSSKSINNLARKIHSETFGNAAFIRGVIEELYENNILYLNKDTGEWKTKASMKDIVIPKSLEQSLELSISTLSIEEINVLKILSIFVQPLFEKIILNYILIESDRISIYNKLKEKGFLIYKISDSGMLIDFSNSLLKNILYLKLEKEKRFNMHVKAAALFEKVLIKTDYYMDEFLRHLEKSKSYEKLYLYSTKGAKVAEKSGNSSKAIEYYKRALKYTSFKNSGIISINIARLYQIDANYDRAYKYFAKANQFSLQCDDCKLEIYALIQMIIIKINNLEAIDLSYPFKVIRELLDKTYYIEGEVYYHYALALKHMFEYDYELALKNAEKALMLCEINKINDDIYAWIKVAISELYIKENRNKEAKELSESATEIFNNGNNNNGYLVSKLTYTLACKQEGEKLENILNKYLEINKLSNKYKVYKKEILSLICISNIYIEEKKYNKAEAYLLNALEREREEAIDVYSAQICSNLCLVYIRLGKLKLAIKYHYLTKQVQTNRKVSENDVINFSFTYALYNILICNYDEASMYLDEVCVFIRNNENFKNILCRYYELKIYECKNEDEIKNIYYKLNNEIEQLENLSSKIEIRISAIRRILDFGYYNFAKELFLKLKDYPKDYDLQAEYIYLEFNFRHENSYNYLINKALRICTFINNQITKANLYSIIGEKYKEIECYSLAINYYYESIALHIDIINALPQKDKFPYINNGEFLKTRKLFIDCLNNSLNINIDFCDLDRIENITQVNKIINELELKNLLENNKMLKLIEDLYEKRYYNDLDNIYKVFEQFSNNTIDNLNIVIKFMARITLADKAMLVIENNSEQNEVVCTYRISDKNEINRYFSLKSDSGEDTLLICNHDEKFNQLDERIIKYGLKSCIYLKLRNKEKDIIGSTSINAKLMLISNNAINYINYESKNKIEKFTTFLLFLLEKYKLTINSTLDKLTGVYNRKYFEDSLVNLIETAYIEKSQFAVIMFDIDDFKNVNDKYGHQKGDEVLIKLTNQVRNCIAKQDIIGRYGGEEFIVILPRTNEEDAFNISENMRRRVEEARILGEKRKVTISMGLALNCKEALISSEEIIKRADQALYKAKNKGKNRCEIWQSDCGVSSNINNELTCVLSGNVTKDYSMALRLKEVAKLVKNKYTKKEKIYEFILLIMQVIECEIVTVFIVKDKQIINSYSKKSECVGFCTVENLNLKLVYKALEESNGEYLVDWDNIDNNNPYGIPDWKSICILPVKCDGEVIAILYLSVSVNEKEFNDNDYNLLNCFAEIGTSIFR